MSLSRTPQGRIVIYRVLAGVHNNPASFNNFITNCTAQHVNSNYQHQQQHFPLTYHLRRQMTERASGPGGLFKSAKKTINPWNQEQKALRLRLYRARVDLEERKRPNSQSATAQSNNEERPKFEDVSDITNFVEQQIEETMRRGGFDNLRNKGRPLPGGQPTSAIEFAMRIMRDNGLRPQWLQLMHDIDHETKCIRTMLVMSLQKRKRRDWEIARSIAQIKIKEVNCKVDSFNLSRPMSVAHLFRLRLRIGDEVRRAVKEVSRQMEIERKNKKEDETSSSISSTSAGSSSCGALEKDLKNEQSKDTWIQIIAKILKGTNGVNSETKEGSPEAATITSGNTHGVKGPETNMEELVKRDK